MQQTYNCEVAAVLPHSEDMMTLASSGIFALVYGLSRIFAECFREPDAFLGYFGGFLTMGMILSLPLCAVGVWLLLRSRHEPA